MATDDQNKESNAFRSGRNAYLAGKSINYRHPACVTDDLSVEWVAGWQAQEKESKTEAAYEAFKNRFPHAWSWASGKNPVSVSYSNEGIALNFNDGKSEYYTLEAIRLIERGLTPEPEPKDPKGIITYGPDR